MRTGKMRSLLPVVSLIMAACSLIGCIPSPQAHAKEAETKEMATKILEHMDRGASDAMLKFSIPQKAAPKRTPIKQERY